MVMIYTADIDKKSEFNRAWDEWVDRRKSAATSVC